MLDMTLEQGKQVFLKALAGNNFSTESIRAYSADLTQFVDFLKSVRVDWNNPQKITRLDIVEFMNRLSGMKRTSLPDTFLKSKLIHEKQQGSISLRSTSAPAGVARV